ncbi:MAG: methylenetetrahydrofolate reductase [NAD(P)H] [Eubacterium sp.]|nr:methylenetetrahydrofolate reductase [NAD(P)H] [Eubacterium sp.]
MKLSELYGKGRVVFSLEVFPPNKRCPVETVYEAVEKLAELKPDYFSVTYGAGGGSTAGTSTCEIASYIKSKCGTDAMAHLTCINNTAADIDTALELFKAHGIDNILALRGDINPDIQPKKDFPHASDLTSYILSKGDFDVAGACYPETHVDADSPVDDILNLKKKTDSGASHLITQLFFDNGCFYDFREKATLAGINVPISAGIMPVTNKKQIERMVTVCGASLPPKFVKILQRYESNPEALRDAGIAYAIDQIVDLISNDVDGIHLYTMNNPYVAYKIHDAISKLL